MSEPHLSCKVGAADRSHKRTGGGEIGVEDVSSCATTSPDALIATREEDGDSPGAGLHELSVGGEHVVIGSLLDLR